MTEERAVSEVLGYVLVIGIVTITVGVVMTLGIGGLEAAQQAEQINNMERGFDVLAHNVEELADRNAPTRATELRIATGSLSFGTPTTINVSVDDELVREQSVVSEPIVYDSGTGTQIVYDSGAVIRSDGGYSTMLSEPRFIFANDTVLIGGIQTRPTAGTIESTSEPGTMLIRGEYLGTLVESENVEDKEAIVIDVETEYPQAWERYFRDQSIGSVTTNHQTVSLQIAVEDLNATEVQVVRTRTRITFSY